MVLLVLTLLCLLGYLARVMQMEVSGSYRRLIQQPEPMTRLSQAQLRSNFVP